jgi:hypothetical protein
MTDSLSEKLLDRGLSLAGQRLDESRVEHVDAPLSRFGGPDITGPLEVLESALKQRA